MQFLHSRQSRAGLLILVLGVAIVIAVAPFAVGLLGAGVLYVMFVGTYRRLRPVLRTHGAATVTLLLAILVVVLPLTWLVGLIVAQAPEMLEAVQSADAVARLSAVSIGTFKVGTAITQAGGTVIGWLSSQAVNLVGGAAHATLNLMIAFFAFFYLLTSGEQGWTVMRRYLPFSPKISNELKDRFLSVTEATILGAALVGLVQGGVVGITFLLVGLPSPAFWGVITALVSVLPVLGSALVWLPGVGVLMLQGHYGGAIVLAAVGGILASNVDNLIRPIVYKRVSDIHPLVTLVGAFAGIKFFGLLGVLLGPLAIAYFFEMSRLYQVEYGSLGADDEVGSVSGGTGAPEDIE